MSHHPQEVISSRQLLSSRVMVWGAAMQVREVVWGQREAWNPLKTSGPLRLEVPKIPQWPCGKVKVGCMQAEGVVEAEVHAFIRVHALGFLC